MKESRLKPLSAVVPPCCRENDGNRTHPRTTTASPPGVLSSVCRIFVRLGPVYIRIIYQRVRMSRILTPGFTFLIVILEVSLSLFPYLYYSIHQVTFIKSLFRTFIQVISSLNTLL